MNIVKTITAEMVNQETALKACVFFNQLDAIWIGLDACVLTVDLEDAGDVAMVLDNIHLFNDRGAEEEDKEIGRLIGRGDSIELKKISAFAKESRGYTIDAFNRYIEQEREYKAKNGCCSNNIIVDRFGYVVKA